MRKISNILRVEELEILVSLVSDNEDLQRRLNILKDEIIELDRLENLKSVYDVSFDDYNDELVIYDSLNGEEYRINRDFLENGNLYKDGCEYRVIIDINEEIYLLESCLFSQNDRRDKELIRYDLASLYNLEAEDIEFVFMDSASWNNQKYISKNDIERFNEFCEDLIETYEEYKNENVAYGA